MKYERVFCATCKDYTIHYGYNGTETCIRHKREDVVRDGSLLLLSGAIIPVMESIENA